MAKRDRCQNVKDCLGCGATICVNLGRCWPCFYKEQGTPVVQQDQTFLKDPYSCSMCRGTHDPRHGPLYVCPECLNGAIKAKCVKCRARAAAAKVKP